MRLSRSFALPVRRFLEPPQAAFKLQTRPARVSQRTMGSPSMGEVLLFLIGLAIVLGLLFVILGMPIIAFVRSRHVAQLRARLEQLAEEVRRLQHVVGSRGEVEAAPPPPAPQPVSSEA